MDLSSVFPSRSRLLRYLLVLVLNLLGLCPFSTSKAMSGNHLTIGSTDPPLQPGKIRMYSMRFCPYSERVHLTFLSKNIPFDPVFINLKAKPEWYTDKVPTGKVPAILIDGQSIYDSLIVSEFLDEKYPERPLHSKDPLQKAKDKILMENFGKVISPFYKVMTGSNASLEQFEEVVKEMTAFDKELQLRNNTFFAGDKPGMVDLVIWPWFERMEMFKVLYGDSFTIPEKKLPTLVKWMKDMKADSAVSQYYLSPEIHAQFMRTHQAGTPDFDILTRQ